MGLFLLFIVPPAAALAAGLLLPHASIGDSFNTAGGILELAGLGIVVWDLSGRRKAVVGVDWLTDLRQAVARHWRRWFGRPEPITGSANLTLPALSAEGKIETYPAHVSTSLEERVEALAARQQALKELIRQVRAEARSNSAKLRENLTQEEKDRRAGDKQLEAQIMEVVGGGLQVEAAGVVWLAFGIFITTWPDVAAAAWVLVTGLFS